MPVEDRKSRSEVPNTIQKGYMDEYLNISLS